MTSSRNAESESVSLDPAIVYVTESYFRFLVRDFTYSEEEIEKERQELENANATEKELWVSSPFAAALPSI